ncbi:ABC transporter ATP-binding protein [Pendulispora albinea]|uniref:ABC transporter ATP-binding protein n=1 Tax=Pendulispora albinea TaxID=2741071 RepID=A0ABZ2M513_9BACT
MGDMGDVRGAGGAGDAVGAPALEVSGLRVARGGRTVVEDVGFVARKGSILGVLGPNGAGKSSLVKAIASILPYEGGISVDGLPVRALERADRARRIAYVPQQTELRSPLTVESVVAQGRYAHHVGRIRPPDSDRAVLARAMELAEADNLAGRVFTALSQGERQRVLLARALATEARVLLLDEPTAALDVGHALRLYRLLRDLAREGYCILAVLHPLEEALDWTDDAILLERGRLVLSGTTRDVFREGSLEHVYGVRLVPEGALGFRLADSGSIPPTGGAAPGGGGS